MLHSLAMSYLLCTEMCQVHTYIHVYEPTSYSCTVCKPCTDECAMLYEYGLQHYIGALYCNKAHNYATHNDFT